MNPSDIARVIKCVAARALQCDLTLQELRLIAALPLMQSEAEQRLSPAGLAQMEAQGWIKFTTPAESRTNWLRTRKADELFLPQPKAQRDQAHARSSGFAKLDLVTTSP